MKLALVVSSMSGGGAERVAATLANAWTRAGHDVVLIPTFLGTSPPAYALSDAVRLAPLQEQVAADSGAIRKLRALRRLVADLQPDVIVSFLTNVNVTAIVALRALRIPLLICERVDPAASVELSWTLRAARALLYQLADALIVQTAAAGARLASHLVRPPQTIVIPNPLPGPLHESPLRAAPVAPAGEIVAMGRLTPQKGFDLLMRAFARAFPGDSAWSLTIWGDGPLRDSLHRLRAELGLATRVRFAGATAQPWPALAAAQIFVLSSAYEGFPNAMLEAMALGVPCVAFDCPSGPRELADGGRAAVLVSPGNVDLLAHALSGLAAAPEKRRALGSLAAEFVRQRFAESEVLAQWQAAFTSVGVRLAR